MQRTKAQALREAPAIFNKSLDQNLGQWRNGDNTSQPLNPKL